LISQSHDFRSVRARIGRLDSGAWSGAVKVV
jgi:hypothetical protein